MLINPPMDSFPLPSLRSRLDRLWRMAFSPGFGKVFRSVIGYESEENSLIGSRSFNGSSDRIDWASILNPTGVPFTFCAWVKSLEYTAVRYICCIQDAGDTIYGININLQASKFNLTKHGITTNYSWLSTTTPFADTNWHHVIICNDGGIVSGSTVLFFDNSSQAFAFSDGSGGETTHSGFWSLGGRIQDDARNWRGNICQAAWYDQDYHNDVNMCTGLATGYSPLFYNLSHLKYYWKGNTSDLHDYIANVLGVADGTTQVSGAGNGPVIVYP